MHKRDNGLRRRSVIKHLLYCDTFPEWMKHEDSGERQNLEDDLYNRMYALKPFLPEDKHSELDALLNGFEELIYLNILELYEEGFRMGASIIMEVAYGMIHFAPSEYS